MSTRAGDASTLTAEGVHRGRRRVRRRRNASAAVAAFWSFVWPGLGQAYLRQPRRALLFAIPPALLIVGALAVAVADPAMAALSLLAPAAASVVIALLAAHALWRVLAIFDAWRSTREAGRLLTDRTLPLAVLLAFIVVALHVPAGIFVQSFAQAGERIFQGDRPTGPSEIDHILGGGPSASPGLLQPGATPTALPGDTNGDGVFDWNDDGWMEEEPTEPEDGEPVEPTPQPGETAPPSGPPNPTPDPGPTLTPPPLPPGGTGGHPSDGPVNVLFIGLDSGTGRTHSLSDTLLLASYYPERDTLTMISVPRDTGRLPMYTGGTYQSRVNTFLNYARANPHLFPEGPVSALMKQLGYVLGIPIHYYAATDLDGLPRAVDEVGGVTITVTQAIHSEKSNYHLEPGTYHFNGAEALRYARVRYGSSDFARARRQQQIIKALALRVRDPGVATRLPEVIDALSEVVRTNVPRDRVPQLLQILDRANDASTRNIVLSPPAGYARVIPPSETGGSYLIELNLAAVRDLSREVFGPYSRY